MNTASFLRKKQVIITLGTGGVGKTSVSAALAVCAARLGMKSLVLTVDPARRLASALGLKVGDEPRKVTTGEGEFFAAMMDLKSSMDRLVEKYSPNPAIASSIINSRIYQIVSDLVSGSQEYLTAERLYEELKKNEYNTIILDTPPAYEAVDFLKAPDRVTEFFSDRFLRWFVGPMARIYRDSFDILLRRLPRIFNPLLKIAGIESLKEFFDFVSSASSMFDDMNERTAEVKEMLRSRYTSFIFVTTPRPTAISEFNMLKNTLGEMKLSLDAVIINRFQPELLTQDQLKKLSGRKSDPFLNTLAEYYVRRRKIHEGIMKEFSNIKGLTVMTIDEIPQGIEGLSGIEKIASELLRPGPAS